jgi:hypothetical protein
MNRPALKDMPASNKPAASCRRVAPRCEKTKRDVAAIVALTAGFILVKSVHTA